MMRLISVQTDKRRGNRTKAVLPVRVKGIDASGKPFDELAHTLDVTPTGVKLGSIRRPLSVLEEIAVFYHQRKMQFRVVWTKKIEGTSEFHVGLQAVTDDRETWGLNFSDFKIQPALASKLGHAFGRV